MDGTNAKTFDVPSRFTSFLGRRCGWLPVSRRSGMCRMLTRTTRPGNDPLDVIHQRSIDTISIQAAEGRGCLEATDTAVPKNP